MTKWGGHRSDGGDQVRQREEVVGVGDQGGGQKEEVRRGSGGIQRKWRSKEVRGRRWEKHTLGALPLQVGFPWQGASGWEAAPGSWCEGEQRRGQPGSGAQARKP